MAYNSDDSFSTTPKTYSTTNSVPTRSIVIAEDLAPTTPTSTPKIQSTLDEFVTGGVKPTQTYSSDEEAPTGGIKPVKDAPVKGTDEVKQPPTPKIGDPCQLSEATFGTYQITEFGLTCVVGKQNEGKQKKVTKNLKPFIIGGAVILGIVVISKILKSSN